MFTVSELASPQTIAVPSGTVILTHTCKTLEVDPRNPKNTITVRTMRGYLDNGRFVDWGEAVEETLDGKGYTDLLAESLGGKEPGDFRIAEIAPAIEKRNAEIEVDVKPIPVRLPPVLPNDASLPAEPS